jgi:predicted PurR-regulated permease PerM
MGKEYSVKDNSSDVEDTKGVTKEVHDGSDSETKKEFFRIGKKKRDVLTIDFSFRLMLFILTILAFMFFAKQLITVILFLFFSFVIMSAIRPVVGWLRKKGLGKGMSIALAYILFFLIIIAVLVLIFVPFINQLAGLIGILPNWITESLSTLEDFSILGYSVKIDTLIEYINEFVKDISSIANVKNIANFISEFFGWGAFLLTSIIFSMYLVSEHDSFADILLIKIVSDEKRERVRKLVTDVEKKLGGWVLGQAVVSTTTATYTGIVLTILGVPFALPLAIFTGFVNVIPNLGSTLASICMALVALISVGPVNALILLFAFVIYQLIENTLIAPKVMGNAVGLKPIIVLLGVIVFLTFFGLVGAFMAVPLMVISKIVYEFYIDLQKLEAKGIV